MQYSSVILAVAFATTVLGAPGGASILSPRADSLTLEASAVQSGSFTDGSTSIGSADVGQAKSATSTNNFINFCAGKTLTNGLQIVGGSCNGIPMGDIPAKTAMVSSIITFPQTGKTIASDTDFDITVQMSNLVAGSFTNAAANYYAAPQALSGGKVVGHTHVSVQDLGNSLNPTVAIDATKFAFFKGINDVGNGNGLLTAKVTGGLPAGNYRVCTIVSSSNHQSVLMPVAQRGSADDCTKFVVTGSGTTANNAASDASGGIAAAAAAQSAVDAFSKSGTAVTAGNAGAGSAVTISAKASATKATATKGKAASETTKASVSDDVKVCSETSTAEATSTKDSKAGATSAAAGAATSTSAGAAATATSVSGSNVQTFTGKLGGTAPAVLFTAGADRPFATDGATFINSGAALQRSCSVQHNLCSTAANTGKLSGGQSQCETQINACNAAITRSKKRFIEADNAFLKIRRSRMVKREFII